jgi:hypothetical protein
MPTYLGDSRRAAPAHVTAVVSDAEPEHALAKRVRRTRVHGYLALPDGTSKPWFDEVARDFMRLLAVDPSVRSFEPRPGKIRLSIDGERVEHTPDFLIERGAERAIVDVARSRGNTEDSRPHITAALHQVCRDRGLTYRRVPRQAVYLEPRFANTCELLRFKSVHPTPEFTFQVVDLLAHRGGSVMRGELEDALGGRDAVVPGLYALVLRRTLLVDMGKPLSRDTRLFLLAERARGR